MFWKGTFAQFRTELDDHLEAINENCRDVADVHELLDQIDCKIERLAGRIDELYVLLGAEATLSSEESALHAYLQLPRSMEDIVSFTDDTIAAIERKLSLLSLKGATVHAIETARGKLFTTNQESAKNISLNNYF